jgi:aryl-alcohol dehydrogenase-like predicted oxidoreductase
MEMKKFLRSGDEISLLGFGCWGIGKSEWVGAKDEESKVVLRKAIDEGINFFDTALAYGNGHSEMLVGEAEKESGKKVFIATKIPSNKREWPAGNHSTLEESFPQDYIIRQTEKSLRNLKRDYIDLQQFHVWHDNWADDEDWICAIDKLKTDGKVRYFGISVNDHQPENCLKAAATGYVDSVQVIFNIFEQKPLEKLFPYCEKHNINIIARVPFDEGALTGNIDPSTIFPLGDWRSNYFRDKRRMDVKRRTDKIWEDVKKCCSSPAETALRYVISFKTVTSVIPGMRKEKNLIANLNSIKKGPLPHEIVDRLRIHRWDKNFYE